jgi:hypothetical protein
LGRFLSDIDWQIVESARSCEEKTNLFTSLISTGLDIIMPEKQVKFHIDDAPWVTNDFKNLIKRRQWALASGNTIAFKFYRNKVNQVRKTLRGNYYTSKVGNLQQLNPKK